MKASCLRTRWLSPSLLLAAVRELDQTAFNEIEESPIPAFLKLDPPNCAACHLFNPFWASWAEAADNMGLEGRVWRVDCGVHQAVCKDRQVAHNGDESNFASAPDASFVGFFDVWTGSVWRRYDGVKDAQTLANWLGGARQRDDGPHLTTPEQNWRDPWVQSFAKHAARSSHTSWETMRQPWADWAPCDADDAFERLCAPIEPQCERDGDIGRGHGQGFGNALYSLSVIRAAPADNCTVRWLGRRREEQLPPRRASTRRRACRRSTRRSASCSPGRARCTRSRASGRVPTPPRASPGSATAAATFRS